MGGDSTPGQTGSLRCPYCKNSIFFMFTGGPHRLTCPNCKRIVSIEVVHDGTKWRSQVINGSARR